jgi:hypothetical protein
MTADGGSRLASPSAAKLTARVAGLVVATILWMVCGAGLLTVDAADPPRGSVGPEDSKWGWFSAISSVDEWFLLSGTAKVVISGTSLRAELYDSRDSVLAITLDGTLKDGRVNVVAVRLSTEDRPRHLAGIRKRTRWKDSLGGRETILLSEPGEPAGLTIGLTRELK